jgi:hypothetical protein
MWLSKEQNKCLKFISRKHTQDNPPQEALKVGVEDIRTTQMSKLFWSWNMLCYTPEQVKTEDKETVQHRQHSLHIQFVCQCESIHHVVMYDSNFHPSSCMLPIQLVSTQPPLLIWYYNPITYILIILNYSAKILQHSHTISVSHNVSSLQLYHWYHTLAEFTYVPSVVADNALYILHIVASEFPSVLHLV